jgi:hypothetical protein
MRQALWITAAIATGLSFADDVPKAFFGTWKVNLKQSQFAAPRTKIEAQENGIKVTPVDESGNPVKLPFQGYVAKYDGNPYPVQLAGEEAMSVSFKRIDKNTIEQTERDKSGKILTVTRRTFAPDGQSMTATTQFKASGSSKEPRTTVLKRVGGPRSPDDPHVGTWEVDRDKSDAGWLRIEPNGNDGIFLVRSDGVQFASKLDGREYTLKNAPGLDTVSLRKTGNNILLITVKRESKPILNYRVEVSADGKELKSSGTSPDFAEETSTVVYEKASEK